MKKIILASAIFLFCFQSIAFCQAGNDAVSNAVSNLKILLTDHIIEKAFLHFDRPYPYYLAGETVYFKAYVTMGERHQPSNLSGILHVELIDKNDVLMQMISLPLISGTGYGDFRLPDTLQKGSYRIRAYTQWMKNDQHPYFFDQYISVGSINSVDRVAENTGQALKPDLQFFPEGGNMVTDVPAKVAFKAIGTNGLGINVKGVIVDNEHKEIAKIATVHLGMGGFIFIPEEGKTYTAMVTFADGSKGAISLPVAQSKGLTLSVNTDDPTKVSIGIRANHAYFKENQNKQLNLLVYYGGALKRYTPKLENAALGLDLPANTFPTGVIRVTLLSETGEPLNERLAFIQNPDMLNLSINANKQAFATHENVQLNLAAKKDGSPVNGSFSVSVVDESKISVDDNAENSILSYFLVTSELKGRIESPNFYFTNVNNVTRNAMDMLMLTQGFRRFEWKDLENVTLSKANAYTPEKQIDISGVLKTKSGAPIANCALDLIPQSGVAMVPQIQTTDNEGKFRFSNVNVSSGMKFVLKAQSSAGRNSVLTLDKPTQGPIITPRDPISSKYSSNADILASLQNNQSQGVITATNGATNVILKEEKANYIKPNSTYRSSNLGGPGHANQVILGDQVKNTPSLSIALNGLLNGVRFNSGVPYFLTSGTISSTGGQSMTPMLIIVDGVKYGGSDGVGIDIVNPNSVEAVEVLNGANASIYGVEGGQGVIVITTRETSDNEKIISTEMSPGIFSIEPNGVYKARGFYSPKYSANEPANNLPDHRTTIFWKPDLITDSGGSASFNFFNADGKGTYRVEVQGMDSNGNIGMQVLRYKVE